MERCTLTQHLKDCEESASRLGNAWALVRAEAVTDAREQLSDPDRVKVVRCRDCRFWEPENSEEGDTSGRCRNDYAPCQNQQTDMTWFCADGEREE